MSDCGFYHPSVGYWQTNAEPDEATLASYPAGTVQVPLKPGEFFEWDGVQWVAQTPPPPTRAELVAAIEAQRDATIAAGVVHDGVLYHADNTFLTEMLGRVMGYQAGVYAGPLPVRTKANTTLMLDMAQHVALAAAVGAHRQDAYVASWAAKDSLE
jgi:hypothetical protein